ncbi:uncharacterized protein BDW70DRAFT_148432 [Aspergillus foveolatus]|uniref:uncharacterized protein n=1 Tax=Aspergillus foveolatus TaxID=210207 RepID=UPI003CCCDB1D
MPCNVDITIQEILKLAEETDPSDIRTMEVLTKPDLATEKATQDVAMDLLLGRCNVLKLKYHVVKNRSADDHNSTLPAQLLILISRKELGPVKLEIEGRLRKRRAELEIMGPARDDSNAQRHFLGKLAPCFQTMTQSAEPNLKLITKVVKLSEQHFGATWDDDGEASYGTSTDSFPFKVPLTLIEKVFESSRGPELVTKRNERMCKSLEALAVSSGQRCLYTCQIAPQQVCEDILDNLMSYYKVARKRFVDIVCQQMIHYFLLETDDGPLQIFSPNLVMSLGTEELEMVAGEDAESKRRRDILKREIENLEAAVSILRS